MLGPLQNAIADHLHHLAGSDPRRAEARYASDPGLFGPESIAWRVHGDFSTMIVGGLTALFLQMLHPSALAGVWDHSDFRGDMAGRLRRTAQFLSRTTYGSTEEALSAIAQVRAIHDRISGHLPDGIPYSANDPDLLTWVHVAGVSSFLHAFIRYGGRLSKDQQDRYYAETAAVAVRLGAVSVPTSRSAAEAYLQAMRSHLAFDSRTAHVADLIRSTPPPALALAPARDLFVLAAVDLLPDWAAEMHNLKIGSPQKPGIRIGMCAARQAIRWALRATEVERSLRSFDPSGEATSGINKNLELP